jgi:hypothetical protein
MKSGELHKKRKGRIAEDSLQSFLYNHPECINWPLLDDDASFWAAELIEAEKIRVNGVGNAVARQLSKDGRVAGGCSFHA